ncbi:hypothetical protein NBRC3188_0622 [Acetobacter pasteurianus NBRC 3188]|uniref:Uncharacterized protein n=1 Tax=Acetobacter pasteurianus NBRC 3188 TaxID=1226663 RepID=A0A401WRI2_ACEPA|nr:hypothetical protein NBRC3188_0622 [Acetobacter pasteurianus NBRC 3188]
MRLMRADSGDAFQADKKEKVESRGLRPCGNIQLQLFQLLFKGATGF